MASKPPRGGLETIKKSKNRLFWYKPGMVHDFAKPGGFVPGAGNFYAFFWKFEKISLKGLGEISSVCLTC
jgi:hypothetical protein